MTRVDIEIKVFKIIGCLVVLAVVIAVVVLTAINIKNWHVKTTHRNDIRAAHKATFLARFPKSGDMIELNGEKIVILKKYVWSRHIRYEVRLPNGEITEVMGSEIIDKKPIGEKDEH